MKKTIIELTEVILGTIAFVWLLSFLLGTLPTMLGGGVSIFTLGLEYSLSVICATIFFLYIVNKEMRREREQEENGREIGDIQARMDTYFSYNGQGR